MDECCVFNKWGVLYNNDLDEYYVECVDMMQDAMAI